MNLRRAIKNNIHSVATSSIDFETNYFSPFAVRLISGCLKNVSLKSS